jgi:hypothetical protein
MLRWVSFGFDFNELCVRRTTVRSRDNPARAMGVGARTAVPRKAASCPSNIHTPPAAAATRNGRPASGADLTEQRIIGSMKRTMADSGNVV